MPVNYVFQVNRVYVYLLSLQAFQTSHKNITMTEGLRALPRWILIVSGLFAVMEIMVSFLLCFSPESVVDTVDLGAQGVDYLIYMWAVRQFALGVIFAFATFKRSVPMLTIVYLFFLVMFTGDLIIGISQKNSLTIAALVMCVVSAAMIYVINRKRL